MVVQGAFQVELVHADSKIPFQEHVNDGNVFVEVEPEAEYFIKVQQRRSFEMNVLCCYEVDGEDLGCYNAFTSHIVRGSPIYTGLVSYTNGNLSNKALKFETLRIACNHQSASSSISSQHAASPQMGSIKIDVYEAIFSGFQLREDFSTSIAAPSARVGSGNHATQKVLRTGEGTTTIYDPECGEAIPKYRQGALIDTIVLSYGSAHTLIKANALSFATTGNSNTNVHRGSRHHSPHQRPRQVPRQRLPPPMNDYYYSNQSQHSMQHYQHPTRHSLHGPDGSRMMAETRGVDTRYHTRTSHNGREMAPPRHSASHYHSHHGPGWTDHYHHNQSQYNRHSHHTRSESRFATQPGRNDYYHQHHRSRARYHGQHYDNRGTSRDYYDYPSPPRHSSNWSYWN